MLASQFIRHNEAPFLKWKLAGKEESYNTTVFKCTMVLLLYSYLCLNLSKMENGVNSGKRKPRIREKIRKHKILENTKYDNDNTRTQNVKSNK